MSRFQSHKNKIFVSQVALAGAGLVLILIFIFTLGLKLLLNTSLFVNQIFNKNSPQPTQSADFFGSFSVDSIPEATNSAQIIVKGSISKYDSITTYLNHEKIEEAPIASDSFSAEVKNLQKGENQIYFVIKSKKYKQEKQSETYKVLFNDEKPKLEISEPVDQLHTDKNEIKVVGTTAKENSLKINDLPIVADVQGKFQTSVRLKDGENKITIVAFDSFGNTEEKTITVFYQKDE